MQDYGEDMLYSYLFYRNILSFCVYVVAAVREPCIEAGLVKVLVPYLNSNNEEMLLNTGRAIGRICFDNCELAWQCWLSQITAYLQLLFPRQLLDYIS